MSPAAAPAKQFEINIQDEFSHPEVSIKSLLKTISGILKDLGFKKAMISLLLVGHRRMKNLNRRYLKHAWSTDVLAFSQGKMTKAPKGAGKTFLGDIVLCIPTIEAQAEEYGHSFKEELEYCLCHGVLHLLGHEDKTRLGHTKMHQKQARILKRIKKRS